MSWFPRSEMRRFPDPVGFGDLVIWSLASRLTKPRLQPISSKTTDIYWHHPWFSKKFLLRHWNFGVLHSGLTTHFFLLRQRRQQGHRPRSRAGSDCPTLRPPRSKVKASRSVHARRFLSKWPQMVTTRQVSRCWMFLCIYTNGCAIIIIIITTIIIIIIRQQLMRHWQKLRQMMQHDQLSMRKICRLGNAERSRLAIMTVSLILATLCEVGNQDKGLDGGMLMSAGREGVILNVREDPRAPSKFEGYKVPPTERIGALACPSGRISSTSFSVRLG